MTMTEDTMRLLREFTVDGVQTFQCVACDATWTNATGPEHHVRCRVGNLQVLVKMLMRDCDDMKRRAALASRGDPTETFGAIVDWRMWARRLLSKAAQQASDSSLRFRLEERMSPTASITERALRVQVAELEGRLGVVQADLQDLRNVVARGER